MSTLQHQARALGDPTRHELFRHLADATEPLPIAELTVRAGLHHNAVRQHLAKLVAAGLVVESTAPPSGRGRPRLVYTVDPHAARRWTGSPDAYERLSELLAEIIRTGDPAVDVGRRAGRSLTAAADAGDGVARVVDAMGQEGFDPSVHEGDDRTEIVLARCPFRTTASSDPDTVCALHLGLAEGLAEGTDVQVVDLVRQDPRRAHCRLVLRPAAVAG